MKTTRRTPETSTARFAALFLALLLIPGMTAFAQGTITTYTRTTFTGTYTPIGGTPILSGDDEYVGMYLPFTFTYDGSNYDRILLSTNGWVELGSPTRPLTAPLDAANSALFSPAAPNITLAPWWDDLTTGTGLVEYAILDTAPNRVFAVEWRNVSSFYLGGRTISFQVRIHETSGAVEFRYGGASGTGSLGESSSFGIEDHIGGSGHFIDGPTGSTTSGTVSLNTTSDWPEVFYRFEPARLLLLSPNGGENLVAGAVDTIRWQSTGINAVRLDYSTNSGATWTMIYDIISVPPYTYPWTVPNAPTAAARIRISETVNPGVLDVSDANFSIQEPPAISVSPDSLSAVLLAGDSITQTITIGNAGPGELKWYAVIGPVFPLIYTTLPSATISPVERVQDRPEPELSGEAPPAGGTWLAPLSAMLADLSGIHIGMFNLPYYTQIASDLTLRGAVLHEMEYPMDPAVLDSLDVVAIDDQIGPLPAGAVNALRTWVQNGHALLIEGDDQGSMTNINTLLSGTGISETSLGGYFNGIFTIIFPHSITLGVDTVYGGSYGSYSDLAYPAIPIVLDDAGRPHVAVSHLGAGRVVVACNEITENGMLTVGDTRRLANQAFDWLAFGADYLTLSPDSGSVASGSARDVSVTYRTAGMLSGDYDATVIVLSNDPANEVAFVPARLHLLGTPGISISSDTIDLGDTFVGDTGSSALTVTNDGSDTLEVGVMVSGSPDFHITGSTLFVLAPFETEEVGVSLTPAAAGPRTATLSISSNDPADPLLHVHLAGNGVQPPVITVSPSSFSVVLSEGDSTTRTLTVGNTGSSDLEWNIGFNVVIPGAAPPARTAAERQDLLRAAEAAGPSGNNEGSPTVSPYPLGALMQKEGNMKILSWVGYADLTPTGEYENTLSAIEEHFTDFSVETTKTQSASELSSLLGGKQVLLVPEQENAGDLSPLGAAFSAVIGSFVGNGGTLIVMDYGGQTAQFLTSTGLLTIQNLVPSINYAVVHDPSSPLVEGVPHAFLAMDGSNYHASPDGEKIVRDSTTGNNRVTLKQVGIGRVIYIGMDFYQYNSSMARLVANAVMTSMPPYLRAEPSSGVVPAGSSTDVTLKFNAAGVPGGDYYSNILVGSNDPAHNTTAVPAHLHVIGMPDISVTADPVDFGEAYIGYGDTLVLGIVNEGSDTLQVTDMSTDNGEFSFLGGTSFSLGRDSLGGDGIYHLTVVFEPAAAGTRTGTLSIFSNDPDESTLDVALTGTGIVPPVMGIVHDTLEGVQLPAGDTASRAITVSNTGGSNLHVTADIAVVSLASQEHTGALYEGLRAGAIIRRPSVKTEPDPRSPQPSAVRAGPGSAQDIPLPVTLVDALGYTWDIDNRGQIIDGLNDAYDGGFRLTGFPNFASAGTEELGREIVIGPADMGSYTVTRKIFVPSGAAFVRYLELLENKTAGPVVAPVDIYTNLGSDGGETFGATSSFDSLFTTEDDWIVTDDAPDVNDPAVVHVIAGPGGLIRPSAVDGGMHEGFVQYAYQVPLPAGGVAAILHFGAQRANGVEGVSVAAGLRDLAFPALIGLGPDERAAVVNFSVTTMFRVSPSSAVVPPSSSAEFRLLYNASGADIGQYPAFVGIRSNEPGAMPHLLPASLTVTVAPGIVLTDDTLDFGTGLIGRIDSLRLGIRNSGNDTLNVADWGIGNPRFAITEGAAFDVSPGETHWTWVTFTPVTPGAESGVLSFLSSDPTNSLTTVAMSGTGFHPAILDANPDTLMLAAYSGDSTTMTLGLSNTGLGAMDFRVEIESWKYGSGPPGPVVMSPNITDGWLSVTPDSGSIPPGANLDLEVKAVTSLLPADAYQASITVVSENLVAGFLEIPVRIDVVTGVADEPAGIPAGFVLWQNYPNPFNPGTMVRFDVPTESHVTITVRNILGQEVASLVDERKLAGRYEVYFDGARLPSGVYFCRMQAGGYTEVRKLLLMK